MLYHSSRNFSVRFSIFSYFIWCCTEILPEEHRNSLGLPDSRFLIEFYFYCIFNLVRLRHNICYGHVCVCAHEVLTVQQYHRPARTLRSIDCCKICNLDLLGDMDESSRIKSEAKAGIWTENTPSSLNGMQNATNLSSST